MTLAKRPNLIGEKREVIVVYGARAIT